MSKLKIFWQRDLICNLYVKFTMTHAHVNTHVNSTHLQPAQVYTGARRLKNVVFGAANKSFQRETATCLDLTVKSIPFKNFCLQP